MGVEIPGEDELEYIGGVVTAIQNDRPDEAIARARERLDLTGAFRLLAYLCVDPETND